MNASSLRVFAGVTALGSMLALAGCGDSPPQTTSTSYEQTTTAPAPMAAPMTPAPMTPGTVTTQTTNTTSPAQ
jgi:hypothetical protein